MTWRVRHAPEAEAESPQRYARRRCLLVGGFAGVEGGVGKGGLTMEEEQRGAKPFAKKASTGHAAS